MDPRPREPRPRRARRRRGSVYVLVLGASLIISAVGLGGIYVATLSAKQAKAERDWSEAGVLAASAVEIAIARMNTESNWRSAIGAQPVDAGTLGRGRVWYRLTDEIDGNIASGDWDPVRVAGKAVVGGATRVYSVSVSPRGTQGLDVLRTALHGESTVRVEETVTVESGPISSDSTLTNTGALIGDVEARGVNNTGRIDGFVIDNAPAKLVPTWSAYSSLVAAATPISMGSLSGDTIDRKVLTPDRNPYGPANARGLYSISVGLGRKLTIKRSRLQATLLVSLNVGATLEVEDGDDAVFWEPGAPSLPTLVVQTSLLSAVNIYGSAGVLSESQTGVNFNPLGSPYLGVTDNDTSDVYPAQIRGVIQVLGATPLVLDNGVSVLGTVIADGAVTVRGNARLIADPALIAAPPHGLTVPDRAVMEATPGTWRWEPASW